MGLKAVFALLILVTSSCSSLEPNQNRGEDETRMNRTLQARDSRLWLVESEDDFGNLHESDSVGFHGEADYPDDNSAPWIVQSAILSYSFDEWQSRPWLYLHSITAPFELLFNGVQVATSSGYRNRHFDWRHLIVAVRLPEPPPGETLDIQFRINVYRGTEDYMYFREFIPLSNREYFEKVVLANSLNIHIYLFISAIGFFMSLFFLLTTFRAPEKRDTLYLGLANLFITLYSLRLGLSLSFLPHLWVYTVSKAMVVMAMVFYTRYLLEIWFPGARVLKWGTLGLGLVTSLLYVLLTRNYNQANTNFVPVSAMLGLMLALAFLITLVAMKRRKLNSLLVSLGFLAAILGSTHDAYHILQGRAVPYMLQGPGILALNLALFVYYALKDLEERRKVRLNNELLQERQRELEALESTQKSFLARVSREYLLPMDELDQTCLKLKTQVGLTENLGTDLKYIHESAQRLRRLLDDLVDYTELQGSNYALDIQSFDPENLVRKLYELLKSRFRGSPVDFRMDLQRGLPLVTGDPARVEQVLINFITNALRNTSQGFVELGCATLWDGMTRFWVKDTGRGISKADQERIFGVFQQVGQDSRSGKIGTGLGLSIARELIHRMESEIHLRSAPGQGSLFWFDMKSGRQAGAPWEAPSWDKLQAKEPRE